MAKKCQIDCRVIERVLFELLSSDPRPVPLEVLKSKFYRHMRFKFDFPYIPDNYFYDSLYSLKKRYLIGENRYGKWFIDYPDYKLSDRIGYGFLEIEDMSGNGFITLKKNKDDYKKSSHFVHKKNLNGAKSGDQVKFAELEVIKRKRLPNFALIDAAVLQVMPAEEELS